MVMERVKVECLPTTQFPVNWSQKSNMPVGRTGFKLVWFQERIWAIGGWNTDVVESL